MAHCLVVFALAACSPVRQVATLGFAQRPSVVVVTRGNPDSAAGWAASLRDSGAATIAAEVNVESSTRSVATTSSELCRIAREAAPDSQLDEILVVDSFVKSTPTQRCIETTCVTTSHSNADCACARWAYEKTTTAISARIVALRMNSCRIVAQARIPAVTVDVARPVPIAFYDEHETATAREEDAVASHRLAFEKIARQRWHTFFPRMAPTVRAIDDHRSLVHDPGKKLDEESSYHVGLPTADKPIPARITKVDASANTFEIDSQGKLAPRDALYEVSPERALGYLDIGGGIVRTADASHGTASATLGARYVRPRTMFEVRVEGDVVPGLATARWGGAGAAGLHYRLGPIDAAVFGEAGLLFAYQEGGARTMGFRTGPGAGIEIALGRYSLFAEVRQRWLVLAAWEAKDGMPTTAAHPERTSASTTFHIAIGGAL